MSSNKNLSKIEALPKSFWRTATEFLNSLEDLKKVLEEEWTALFTQDTTALLKINGKKQSCVGHMLKKQKKLHLTADTIVTAIGGKPGDERWDYIKTSVSAKQLHELETWMNKCKMLEMEIKAMNKRHLQWIDEQLETTRKLLDIFAGKVGMEGVVYDTNGKMRNDYGLHSRAAGF